MNIKEYFKNAPPYILLANFWMVALYLYALICAPMLVLVLSAIIATIASFVSSLIYFIEYIEEIQRQKRYQKYMKD